MTHACIGNLIFSYTYEKGDLPVLVPPLSAPKPGLNMTFYLVRLHRLLTRQTQPRYDVHQAYSPHCVRNKAPLLEHTATRIN